MAKISFPKKTIFPDPSVAKFARPPGGAGLEHRIAAQTAARTANLITQTANFATDALKFGVEVKELRALKNQQDSGEFMVAKANAESRFLSEEDRALNPEPLEERKEQLAVGPTPEGGFVDRIRGDAELYEDRFLELSRDLQDIGQGLKGNAKKAYDLWLATQAPEYQRTLFNHYSDRIDSENLAKANVVIQDSVDRGDSEAVRASIQEAVDGGIIKKADAITLREEALSESVFNNILGKVIKIADTKGFEAAVAALDSVRAEDFKNYINEGQLEKIRDQVKQRLTDKFEQDNRVYEEQVLRPTEKVLQEALNSYIFGDNFRDTGVPLTASDVNNIIQGSDMRGDDQLRWVRAVLVEQDRKRDINAKSNPATLLEAFDKVTDPEEDPGVTRDWLSDQGEKETLTAGDMQTLFGKKLTIYENPSWETANELGKAMIQNDSISAPQYADINTAVIEWSRTIDGQKALAENSAAILWKTQELIGRKTLQNLNAEVQGFYDKKELEQLQLANEALAFTRAGAIKLDPTMSKWGDDLFLTGAIGDQYFSMTTLSLGIRKKPGEEPKYDANASQVDKGIVDRLEETTGIQMEAYGVGTAGVEGYIGRFNKKVEVWDVFRLTADNKVQFWDTRRKATRGGVWVDYTDNKFARRD